MNTILQLEHITKSFPGVLALSDVNLSLNKGEVLGLVGENGAGKSTLMKILTGIYKKDSGTIRLDGKEVDIRSPLHAQQLGLSIIFQEFNLVKSLSIAENIFTGRLPKKNSLRIDWKEVHSRAQQFLTDVGLDIPSRVKVENLSVAQMQMVEIAKALSFDSKIIFMDEPSATLTDNELVNLFAIIRQLREHGKTVIYISHRLQEVFELCDRVTVLRDGQVIETAAIKDCTKEGIIAAMVGRNIEQEYPKRATCVQREIVMSVRNLSSPGKFEDVSFDLRKGEVLGFAGLVGSGRTEIARALFGADPSGSGEIRIDSKPYIRPTPLKSIKQHLAFLTENRKEEGLILPESVSKHISMASMDSVTTGTGLIQRKKERQIAEGFIHGLGIKTTGPEQAVVNLSGGNQQKILIAKWLHTKADIFIFDEPTRGIDVGAKYEIYLLINKLVSQGKSVIMISSELPEVIAMSDRLLVIHEGRIKGELSGSRMTPERVMSVAIG